MDKSNIRSYIREYNNISNQCNSIYHSVAQKAGVSDCALSIFTVLCEDEKYTQSDICSKLCLPRQTVNSALKKMAQDGYISLVRTQGAGKHIVLTPKGEQFVKDYVMPVIEAENITCASFSDGEIANCLDTFSRFVAILKENIDAFPQPSDGNGL